MANMREKLLLSRPQRNDPHNPADKYGVRYHEEEPPYIEQPFIADQILGTMEHKIKNGLNPLTDIARIIKELPYGQMVELITEMRSVSDKLDEKLMWNWACKRVQGEFDGAKEEPTET